MEEKKSAPDTLKNGQNDQAYDDQYDTKGRQDLLKNDQATKNQVAPGEDQKDGKAEKKEVELTEEQKL